MAKLTTRDYKRTTRRPLVISRWREFGFGLLAGAALASVAFVYAGGRTHRAAELADAPHPDPHRAREANGDPGAAPLAKGSEKYDFYQMLPN
ncbi:MAG TPA: hypothetical protein VGH61_09635, partial [Steroidobacteraceae bacterium]